MLAAATVVLGALWVHRDGVRTELQMSPVAAPPRVLHVWGHDYQRSRVSAADSRPVHALAVGTTRDGGVILKPAARPVRRAVPGVIWVDDREGDYWRYALVGGR
jgi:hypothetical protein